MAVAGEACSGEAALQAADRLSPHLVIVDMRMPGIGGIEATRRLTRGHPEILVFLISVDGEHVDARSCGAVTFLRKQQLSTRALRDAWDAHRG